MRTFHITPDQLRDSYRVCYIRNKVAAILQEVAPTLVVFEGYSMGVSRKTMGRLADLGEVGGVLKLLTWELGIDALIVPPSTMKSLIAGNGHAQKTDVKAALRAQYGYDVPQDDEADALGLLLVGEHTLGCFTLKTDKKRLSSLSKCRMIPGQRKLL